MRLLKSEHDFSVSVERALTEIDPDWESYAGLLIVGSHTPADVDQKIDELKKARWTNVPTLGICFGMQLMAIEYAKNAMDINDATSEEFSENGTPVVVKLAELRVGIRPVEWSGKRTMESHWHNYTVNMTGTIRKDIEKDFVCTYTDGILEIMQHRTQNFYTGIQFHPEYQSSKGRPHPLLANFIKACKQYTAVGLRASAN